MDNGLVGWGTGQINSIMDGDGMFRGFVFLESFEIWSLFKFWRGFVLSNHPPLNFRHRRILSSRSGGFVICEQNW